MKKGILLTRVFALAALFFAFTPAIVAQQSVTPKSQKESYRELLRKTQNTVSFIENKGQFGDQSVLATGHTNIGNIAVRNDMLYFISPKHEEHDEAEEEEEEEEGEGTTYHEVHAWGIIMEGRNQNFTISKENKLPTIYNYFQGADPAYHASEVPSYGELTLNNIYDGIDLRMYSQADNVLEFDWLVNPGADYNNIKLRFKGQDGLSIDEKGNLNVKLRFDDVKFDIPESYQVIDGKKVRVRMEMRVEGDVVTFKALDKINNQYPLVIDPSLKWGTWFDNNDNNFDEYLFAVDLDNQGNVYCGGNINVQLTSGAGNYINPATLFGYDATYAGSVDGIIYKIRFDGAVLMAITYFSSTGNSNDRLYGLGLSPDKSVVYVCGLTAGTLPAGSTAAFDNSAGGGTDGFVAAFPSSNLATLLYASYIGGTGADEMVSIRGLSNNSFVVGGTVGAALPAAYIASAYDATYSNGTEMYIGKFTSFNTLAFGTYVGGSSNDQLNDLNVFSDGALAFSGYTNSSAATFPGLINAASSAGSGQDGVVGVIPSAGGTFSMLSRIGGSGDDQFYGLTVGPFDTLFITGYTSSNNFPLGVGASATTRFDITYAAGQDGLIAKVPRTGFTGGTDPYMATYFGGSSDDRGNTCRTYTPYAVMVFGETQSTNFPVLNLADGGTFYDGTHNSGWDIFWIVLGTDLKTQYFATYLGGPNNDYLGQTGTPHGSNHFQVEGDTIICLGTTVHSAALTPNPIGGGAFDLTNSTATDDIHLIFKWRIGGNLLNFDFGDAPASYGTNENHFIFGSIKLGSLIDREDFHPLTPGTWANYDDSNGATPDDEDAITGLQVMVRDSATSFTQTINITNTTGQVATVAGWIDFDKDGVFENSEVDTARVASGATNATLTWTSTTGWSAGASDTSYVRFRISTAAAMNSATPPATGIMTDGEVEDYIALRYHCVDFTNANVTTTNPTSCGGNQGSITVTVPVSQLANGLYTIYYIRGGTQFGPFSLNASGGVLTIPNLVAGSYTTIQVFSPTNPLCGDTLDGPVVLVDPASPAKPGITASALQVCVNGSFTLTATGAGGATYAWTGPGGFTASTAAITRSPATLAMTGSYCVHQTVAGCVSADSCITVTVNPLPTLSASSNTPVCTGATINLSSTPGAGTSPYTFNWSGPSSFSSSLEDPTRGPATSAMGGTYNVTVTDSRSCTATASTAVVVNTSPSVAPTSNSPVCSGGTINLFANPTGTISTYSWSGPASFSSSAQNPTRPSALTTHSGTYTVNVTATNGCTATGNVNVTVNQTPSAAPTSNGPICAGNTLSFNANPSGGTTPYTFTWSGPVALTNPTSQTPFVSSATTAATGTYNVTVTSANGCSVTASVAATVNANPTSTPTSNSPICQNAQLNLFSGPAGGLAPYTFTWSGPGGFSNSAQNPTIPNAQPANSGTYNVTVTDNRSCSATGSVSVTVNPNPSISASSNSPVCAPTALNLSSTPSGGSGVFSTFNWSGPGGYSASVEDPVRSPSTTAMSGTYNVTVTDNRGCTATAATSVTVNSTLVASAGSNSPVCTGGTLNLTSSPGGAASYVWSGPGGYSSNAQNPVRTSAVAGYAGTYNVTITDANGCSGSASTVVVINSGITTAPSSNTPVCTGAQVNLFSNVTGGTAPITYTWTGPASFSSSAVNPTRAGATIAMAGTYNITVSDVNGCSASSSTNVVINQSPSISAGSNSPVCSGLALNLTSSPAAGTTPYSFTWSGPGGYSASVEDPTRNPATTAMSGTYNVTVTDANLCSATASTSVTVNQSPSITASSNTPVCETLTLNLNSNPSSGTTPYSFSWSGPVSFGSAAEDPTRSGMTLAMAGIYSVTVTDANSCTASASTTVVVTPKPATETASASPNPICTGNTLNLSVTGSGGTWSWTGPNSFSSSLQNPSIASVTLAAAGTYNVTHTVSGCTSDAASVVVVVNTTPPAPTAGASPNPICSGNTLSLSATGVGTSWSWTGPNGFASIAQNPTIPNITTAGTGTYSVFQTILGCTSVTPGTVSVTVNQTPTAPTPTSNAPRCYGDTLKLFAATVAGATYSWTGPGGYTSTDQNPIRVNCTPAMNGTYTLVITVNGCPSVNSATVNVVSIASCPPEAIDDAYTTNEDQTLVVPPTGILVNDFDNASPPQGLTLNTTPICLPDNGSVTINANGSFTYIPNTNFVGNDTFCYSICDNEVPVACDTAIVVITVLPINDPPVVNDSTVTTPEDNPITICLPITDPETATQSHLLSAITCGPTNGIITGAVVNNGSNPHTICITYSPNLNFNGSDSICITICDNGTPQLCDNAVININVTPVNDKPVAVDDYFTSCVDTPLVKNFMTNDFDVDGPSLQYSGIVFGPFSGTITSGPTIGGQFTYTPPALFNGIDSFAYRICDNGTPNLCDTGVVILDFSCLNVPPIAINDNFVINEDQTLNADVSPNDSDPDGGTLTWNTTPIVNVSHGTLVLGSNGLFTYIPTPNYFGSDSFVYSVCDNGVPVKCDTATVYITILPVNDPPIIPDTTVTTGEDTAINVCLPITEIDVIDLHIAAIYCNPAHGTLSGLTVNNIGNPHQVCVIYSPAANYNGTDSFCIIVCDNGTPSKCDTAVVHINVNPVNDPPVANNDNYTTNEDVTLNVSSPGVMTNDSDVDGPSLTVTATPVVPPAHGSVTLNANGSFTYIPALNYCGSDSFVYQLCDNGVPNLCDNATVYITVICVNDPPVIPDTTVTTGEDTAKTICLDITDPETASQSHSSFILCNATNGSITAPNVNNAANPHVVCITYTPNTNFNGSDSICIVVCDNGSPILCDTSIIHINVTPVNDPPIANNDFYSTNEDVNITATVGTGVRANDNDNADGNPVSSLTVTTTPVCPVQHGSLTLNADGSFLYVPAANYCGTDSFCYRVCDAGTPLPSLCDTAVAYITINCTNDPPVVPDVNVTIPEDTSGVTICIDITDPESATQLHIVSLCGPPQNGVILSGPVVNNGVNPHTVCVTYRPNANFNGLDSICVTVCDNGTPFLCDNAVIHITVTPVNDPPIALNDNYTTAEDVPVVASVGAGVRANDNDNADGNPVSSLVVNTTPVCPVQHGTLSLAADGSFTYTPTAQYCGNDSFCYQICDAGTPLPSLCDTGIAYITITCQNDIPEIPDTIVTTPEDTPVTVCMDIDDQDILDIHSYSICGNPVNGTAVITVNNGVVPHQLCVTYTPAVNFYGQDSICIIVCDNGTPQGCDTSHITITVTPVNDPPWADTIYVYTYENQPVGVNLGGSSGDPDGNPLSYTYGLPNPANGTYVITGNGTIDVIPNPGFSGTFAIPYSVCDFSPYAVNVLCDSAVIYVIVLPAGDTLNNHAPVANNDFATTPVNTPVVVNVLGNDYDPDGDYPLQVTVTTLPQHGTVSVNPDGSINYTPAAGFSGYDTLVYTLCDPVGTTLPRPLCDQAMVIISINLDPIVAVNDPPIAADDFAEICANSSVIFHLLQNDYDQNGDAITSCTIIQNVSNGTLTNPGFGTYIYDPNNGFSGYDTLLYRICDNGTPSLCDTGMAVIHVLPNPILTPNVASITNCSNDSVHILVTSNVPGTVITWTATNGTNGSGDVHTVLINSGSTDVTVTYTFTGISAGGCGSATIAVPVTVKPRPTASASVNSTEVCSGDNVVINLSSTIGGTTFAWFGSDGSSGTGTPISVNPVNNGTSTIVVNYVIIPTFNGCTGDSLVVPISVKPRPVLSVNPASQTVCSGTPITVTVSSTVSGTTVIWTGSNGNSGFGFTINDSPINITGGNIVVTYTVNGSFNGCNASTVFATVTVRPRVVADAGQDKSATSCSGSCVQIGGSPTGSGGTGAFTYSWTPTTNLDDAAIANPTACNVTSNTTYTVVVTDAFGCSASDAMQITISGSSLTAEAGAGGAFCAGSGDSVMLGGFPTAVGGMPPYIYTWAPAGLNLTNPANPWAFPTSNTRYYLTVTDALGCTSIDSTFVTVHPQVFANAGTDDTVCAGFAAQLGGSPTATGGTPGYSYAWAPTIGVSNIAVSNPTATPTVTTSYVVTVIDGNNCQASDTIKITVNPAPVAQAGPDKTITQCPGDSVILGDNPAAVGGTPGYTYSWSPSTGIVTSTTDANPVVKGLLSAQAYTLVVTDVNGCTGSDNVTINVSPNNLSVNAGNDKEICAGNTVQLGAIPVVVGGNPPYTYTWIGGSLNDSTQSNPVAQPSLSTNYTVNVTDNKGCSASEQVFVTVNPNPSADAGVDTSVCIGSAITIGGSPTASGGTPGYTYSWTPTTGLSIPNVSNPDAAPVVQTTYTVLVTDAEGCADFDEVVVTPRPSPIVDAGSDKTIVNCTGDTACIIVNISSGNAPFTYEWTPGTGVSDSTAQNICITGISATTSYQLLVTDIYGCQGVDFVIVNVVPSTLQVDAGNASQICAGAGTQVTLGGSPTAVGGTAPFTYSWGSSPAGFSSSLPNPQTVPNGTTTYFVTVTDSKGCTGVDSVTVVQNASPSASAGQGATICSGLCTTIGGTPTGSGGTNPLQYSWTPTIGLNANNIPNPQACPLVTTTYTVQVTDSNGCIASSSVTINVNPVPVADAGVDQTMTGCIQDTVTIGGSPTASAGTPGYTYSWSPSGSLIPDGTVSNPQVTGLSGSQLFSVLVTDANGCTATDAVVVNVSVTSLTAEAGNGATICAGTGTSVVLGGIPTAVGGVAPYTYSWSNGLPNTANPSVTPSVTTTYYLTVTDSKGCTAVDSVKVIVNEAPVAHAGNDTAVCSMQPVRLGAAFTATGGTAPYSYNWSPTLGLSSATAANPIATATVNTTYSVTVTDANGCTASDAIIITINPNPSANAGTDKTIVACSSDSVQIGGSPTASGGTPGYTYSWIPTAGLTNDTIANPYVKNIGSTSVYTIVVTDANGCSASDQVTVIVNNPTMIAEAGNNVSFCQGASVSVQLGGSPTVVGGTPAYTYTWTSVPSGFNSNVANPIVTPVQTTSYHLMVVDASGCFAEDTVLITINPRPVVSAGITDTICAGECRQLGGAPTASGGTGSFTYNWTPAFFFQGPSNVANPIVCPTNNITYQVQVTDSLGCSNTASVTIRVNQNPVANAGQDQSIVSCENSCIFIGGTPTANNGTPPYLYAWAPSTALDNTGLPNPSVCGLSGAPVTYSVTVTDFNGCTAADQVLVTPVLSTLTADAGFDKSICAGVTGCVTIGGAPSVSGGSLPYLIEWSPVQGICNANNIPNPDVNPTDTTTYVLLVTDALGCQAVDSMVLFANPAVTAIVGPDTFICSGGAAQLGGFPSTAGGGTAPYTFQWSPGTGLNNATGEHPVANPAVSTTYCVTVTDAVGCSSSTCQAVNVNQSVIADAGPDYTVVDCGNSFVQIGGSPTASGGSNNYTYLWTPASPYLIGATLPNPFVVGLDTTTTFLLTVTDNATGCSDTDQVKITVQPSTLEVDAGQDKTFCANNAACVQIGGTPTAQGGSLPYIYQWASETGSIQGLSNPNIANPCAAPLVTTMYYVTVTDANGCFEVDSMTVIVSPVIVANAGADAQICAGSTITLGATPTGIGGTGPLSYNWSAGAFPVNTANPSATPLSNTSYTVTVTDSLGCSASDQVNITLRPLPIANAGPDATIFACSSDSAILGGSPTGSGTTGPYTFLWTPFAGLNDSSLSNPVVSNLGFATIFDVSVTDTFGCVAHDQVQVTVTPNTLFVEAGVNLPSQCTNNPGCVTLGGSPTITGTGTPPYVFQWFGGVVSDPASPNPQACPLTTTSYQLVVTDANGCQAADSATVIVNDPPIVTLDGLDEVYCVNSPNVIMNGLPAGGTYSGAFVTGNVFSPSQAGQGTWCITYSYTDPATGCSDAVTVCVFVSPLPSVSASGFAVNYCRYDAPVSIITSHPEDTVSGSGVSGNTQSGFIFDPALANIGNNVITVSYTDPQSGCTGTAQYTINVKDAPTIDIVAADDTVCAGQSTMITPTYSFDVFNIIYSTCGGGPFASGLNPIPVTPTGVDYCLIATAVNTPNNCQASDTIYIHVNQNPVAVDDVDVSTCEEQPVTVSVTVNDTDPEGDSNVVTVVSVGHGTATVSGGDITYTPALNYNGWDTIAYSVCNSQCLTACDTAYIYMPICPINDTPVVIDVIDTIYENETDTVCPVVIDVDGDPTTITIIPCGTMNGTVTVQGGCVIYTPTLNWTGTQVICIEVCDTAGACTTGTITIVVLPTNNPPFTYKVNATVCINTSIGINVSASAHDPDGDPLTFSYLATAPTGHSTWTVTGNGAGVFSADSAGYYYIPYIACDQSGIPPFSLCDTNLIIVRVINCDSTNNPPQASDDGVVTTPNTPTVINELANDFDPDGDPLNVTLTCGPFVPGATVVLNADLSVTYTSPIVACDSICYVICDPDNACDTAVIYICTDSALANHPPVAVDDFGTTDYMTPITIHVTGNDHDPDGNVFTVTSIPCPPSDGTVSISGSGDITYTPGPNANALDPDTFCYVICDNGSPSLCDTATVVIYINNSVQGVPECDATSVTAAIDIDVLGNDFDPENDAFTVIDVLSTGATTGTVSINNDGTIHYIPSQNVCGNIDSFLYVIQDENGATDTVAVCVTVSCCRPPVAINDTATVIPGVPFTICFGCNDAGNDTAVTGSLLSGPSNGTVVLVNDSVLTYTANANFCGTDTVYYQITNSCGSDTGLAIFTANCNTPPTAVNDTVTLCQDSVSLIDVLLNDTDLEGDSLFLTGFGLPVPSGLGGITSIAGNVLTFTSSGVLGTTTVQYYVCDNGLPSKCDTASIVVTIVPCSPFVITPVVDTICANDEAGKTICVENNVSGGKPGVPWQITLLCPPKLGTLSNQTDSCFHYTPSGTGFGNDTFCIRVCTDDFVSCDSSSVIITVLDCIIQALDEPCDLDTTIINTPITIDVLANDIIPAAADTSVTILTTTTHGTFTVNADHTVTYLPALDDTTDVTVQYLVCVTTGSYSYCDSAEICITVIDTAVDCTIPNAISPNSDAANDAFIIPCNDDNPLADLVIYNRWGVEVWRSDGHYLNNWDAHNKQGTVLPDGTYYYIYSLNDGSGKRIQGFVVVHR